MGLDWKVGHKPAPGHEAAGWAALRRALANPDDEAALAAWLATPTVASWVTAGAPRVCDDADAAEWLLDAAQVPEDLRTSDRARQLLAENADLYVLALAVVTDGIPHYSHGGLYEGVDETSFRGQMLQVAEALIGPVLLQRAWDRMLPDELAEYGHALLDIALRETDRLEARDAVEAYEAPEDASPEVEAAHIAASAGRWCLWWAARGHWKDVWF